MGNQIRAALKLLTKAQKEQLRLAHDHGVAQYFKLPDNKFVGVHLNGVPILKISEEYNDWFYGDLIINH